MTYPNSNPFAGSSLFTAGPSQPQLAGGMISQLFGMFGGGMLPPGMSMGSFGGMQNYADVQRALAFQRDVSLASTVTAAQADEHIARLMMGGQQLTQGTALTPAQQAHWRNVASGSGTMLSIAAPFMGNAAPGVMQAFDAVGLGGTVAPGMLMNMGRAQIDPITGRPGWSAATVNEYTRTMGGMYFNTDAVAPNAMQGHGMGAVAQMMTVAARAGILPSSPMSREAIDNLRSGMDVRDALTAEERQRIGPRGMGRLAAARAEGDIDTGIRRVEALEMGKFGERMSGFKRAMEDLFGPGKSVEEFITLANSLTQGGLSRMSLGQMQSVVRRMDSLTSMTGFSVQDMANLQATAANFAERGGGSRAVGVGGEMYAAALTASAGDFSGTGITKSEFAQKAAALYGAAGVSRVGQQFAALQRIGQMYKFEAGSEAEAMNNAVSRGESTYTWKGKTKSAYMTDQGEWQRIVAGGNSELNQGDVARMAMDREINEQYLSEKGTRAAQRSQYGTDIEPRLRSIVEQATGRRRAAGEAMTERVWSTITNFRQDPSLGYVENRNAMIQQVERDLAGSGVRNSRRAAIGIVDQADVMARGLGQDNAMVLGRLHGGSDAAVDSTMARGDAKAVLDEKMSSIGRTDITKRIADAIKNAKPGTKWEDIAAAAVGTVSEGDVNAAFAAATSQIKGDKTLSPAQRKEALAQIEAERAKVDIFRKDSEKRIIDEEMERSREALEAAGITPEEKADKAASKDASTDVTGKDGTMRITGDLTLKSDGTLHMDAIVGEGHTPVSGTK